ncbi:MAG: hypothetical protein AAFQ74_04425 [Cyanobacteria bacterium J06623_4]
MANFPASSRFSKPKSTKIGQSKHSCGFAGLPGGVQDKVTLLSDH